MTNIEIFEKQNKGYLEQYSYSLKKNESGNYISHDTSTLYHGYRQAIPKIKELEAKLVEYKCRLDGAGDRENELEKKLAEADKAFVNLNNTVRLTNKLMDEKTEKLKVAVEALEFYGNKDLWSIGGGTNEIPLFNKIIESSKDSEWFEQYRHHVSGGIARSALEKISEGV
jgi:chromosome segregation ATPase